MNRTLLSQAACAALWLVSPPAAAVELHPPVPVQLDLRPPVTGYLQPAPRRSIAMRATGITMVAIGVAQIAVGGGLIGLANSSCEGADCRAAHQLTGGIAVPVMVVGAVFALAPGAILWGWGNRLRL